MRRNPNVCAEAPLVSLPSMHCFRSSQVFIALGLCSVFGCAEGRLPEEAELPTTFSDPDGSAFATYPAGDASRAPVADPDMDRPRPIDGGTDALQARGDAGASDASSANDVAQPPPPPPPDAGPVLCPPQISIYGEDGTDCSSNSQCTCGAICSYLGGLTGKKCCMQLNAGCVVDNDCCGQMLCRNQRCYQPGR